MSTRRARCRIALSLAIATLATSVVGPALASDAEYPPAATAQAEPEQTLAPDSSEGFGTGSVGGELGLLDADKQQSDRSLGGGFNVAVVGRRRAWPFMVGLGAGVLRFREVEQQGPVAGYTDSAGRRSLSGTTAVRSVELRHAELLLRVQPFWGLVRPYVEGLVGLGVLWNTSSLKSYDDVTLASHDKQRSIAVLYGGSVGLDVRLFSLGPAASGTTDILLSMGVRRWYTGPMQRPSYVAGDDVAVHTSSARAHLALWIPFIALTIAVDSRAESRTHAE